MLNLNIEEYYFENDYTYSVMIDNEIYYLNEKENKLNKQDSNYFIEISEEEKKFIINECLKDLPF